MQSSVSEIRRRLLFLLLRAFVIVLFLSFLFFTFIIGYFLTSSSTPVPFPFVSTLEGYYLAKGNWDGVEAVFDAMDGKAHNDHNLSLHAIGHNRLWMAKRCAE